MNLDAIQSNPKEVNPHDSTKLCSNRTLPSTLHLLRRHEHTNRSRSVLNRTIDNKPQSKHP